MVAKIMNHHNDIMASTILCGETTGNQTKGQLCEAWIIFFIVNMNKIFSK